MIITATAIAMTAAGDRTGTATVDLGSTGAANL